METHRYHRRRLVTGTQDAYDSLSTGHPERFPTLEYWTNGTTTHLVVVMKPPPAVVSSSTTTTTTTAPRRPAPPVRTWLVAGSVAGMASTLAVHPFDVIRTKMQAAARHAATRHATLWHMTAQTIQNGGLRGLYAGLALPLAAQAIYKATVFTVYEWTKTVLLDAKQLEFHKRGRVHEQVSLNKADLFLCGFLGGAVNAAVFVTPVEFVRNQLILQQDAHLMGVLRATKRWSGLWRGVGLTVARDSLGCGCFFVTLAYCQQQQQQQQQQQRADEKPSLSGTVLSGACAGLGFWAVGLPLDCLKTWVQHGTATSATQALAESYRKVGFQRTVLRLVQGWPVAFGRGAPSAAITMATYEFCCRYLEKL